MLNGQSEHDVEAAASLLFNELLDVVKEQLDMMNDLLLRIERARNRMTPTAEPLRSGHRGE